MTAKKVVKLSIGRPKQMNYKEGEMLTGIDKKRVESADLGFDGFEGDDVADKKHHGGPDRAVCVYPHEHYAFWENEFGTGLPDAPFGENLTVTNMTERDVCVGDIYRIGSALIQVTQGRMPCVTINKQTQKQKLMKRMIDTGYTGYLCRVIEPGTIKHDDEVECVESGTVSVYESHEAYYHDKENIELLKRVTAVDVLADRWKTRLEERLKRLLEGN